MSPSQGIDSGAQKGPSVEGATEGCGVLRSSERQPCVLLAHVSGRSGPATPRHRGSCSRQRGQPPRRRPRRRGCRGARDDQAAGSADRRVVRERGAPRPGRASTPVAQQGAHRIVVAASEGHHAIGTSQQARSAVPVAVAGPTSPPAAARRTSGCVGSTAKPPECHYVASSGGLRPPCQPALLAPS